MTAYQQLTNLFDRVIWIKGSMMAEHDSFQPAELAHQAMTILGIPGTEHTTYESGKVRMDRAEIHADQLSGQTGDKVRMVLVPVEVFGADECEHPGCEDQRCPGAGHGLMDAVGPGWSDCNRAEGRVYRVEDVTGYALMDEGQQVRVEIWVRPEDVPFFDRRHGERFEGPAKRQVREAQECRPTAPCAHCRERLAEQQ